MYKVVYNSGFPVSIEFEFVTVIYKGHVHKVQFLFCFSFLLQIPPITYKILHKYQCNTRILLHN
jgi:hypothetical protein